MRIDLFRSSIHANFWFRYRPMFAEKKTRFFGIFLCKKIVVSPGFWIFRIRKIVVFFTRIFIINLKKDTVKITKIPDFEQHWQNPSLFFESGIVCNVRGAALPLLGEIVWSGLSPRNPFLTEESGACYWCGLCQMLVVYSIISTNSFYHDSNRGFLKLHILKSPFLDRKHGLGSDLK